MTFRSLVKMKCCVVVFSTLITASLIYTNSVINAGISGTVALIYGIALVMLLGIGCYDRCVNRECLEELKQAERELL